MRTKNRNVIVLNLLVRSDERDIISQIDENWEADSSTDDSVLSRLKGTVTPDDSKLSDEERRGMLYGRRG